MFYSKETFELRKKTSRDILKDEQNDEDEVAYSSSLKKEDKISYKEKNEQFLTNFKESEKLVDLKEIKNAQMKNFAATSSEFYNMPAKHSVLLYILLIIFSLLLVASATVVLYFNFSQYRVMSYEYNDMKPEFSKGTVFMINQYTEISSDSVDSVIFFRNESGKDVLRKIVSVDDLENFRISISTLEADAVPEVFDLNNSAVTIYGVVTQTFGNGVGTFMYYLTNYGYILCAVFFVLVIVVLVVKAVLGRKASMEFMDRMDRERASIEKRRRQLSEGLSQMQSGDADNMDLLSDLLNVSSTIPGEGKRLEQINKQLKERQLKQVEKIKTGEEAQEEESAEKKKENEVINFVRNEIERQEQNNSLTEEEIAKRLKEAENINKNI